MRARVLVVDDNAENRALAHATLDDEGYCVTLARGGAEGIAVVTTDPPDCILMDVRMPGVDGIAACTAIRALPRGDEIAVIFVTAQRDVETFDRALAAGGDDFITKPYRPDELIVRVQTAMRLRRLAKERGDLFAELKQQRDRLQRIELQREQLIAFVVHDLKNPVNAIELNAKSAQRAAGDEARVTRATTRIVEETSTLLRMITNLLDISKADEGKLAPACVAIDLAALVAHAIADLQSRADAASVKLVLDVPELALRADRDLIERVIVNLIDNAIRHAPEDSTIRASAVRADGGIELRIADGGPGIPVEQRDTVFDRFHSAGGMRGNRGLGLAFCKLAVEAHGGRIWIEDAAPGAVFCVRLPDAP